MQFFPTAVCNVTAWRHSRLRAHWLMVIVGGGGLEEKYVFCVPRELQRLQTLFCLWAEFNGGENSLHWKANVLPLFSIMTLWKFSLKTMSVNPIEAWNKEKQLRR